MRRFYLFCLFLTFLICGTVANAQVGLSPQILDISLDGPAGSHSFRLFNYTKEDKAVKVSTANWTMDADGKVSTIATTEQSLDGWLVINPVEFVVKAGQNQVVRIAARPAVALGAGEHRAMVWFDEQPLPGAPSAATTLRTVFRFGGAVYGHVGPVQRQGELIDVQARDGDATLQLRNTGNATSRCSGSYAIWRKAEFPGDAKTGVVEKVGTDDMVLPEGAVMAGRLPNDAVLPEASRRVVFAYTGNRLPPGEYVLDLNGSFGDSTVDRSVAFRVPAAAH